MSNLGVYIPQGVTVGTQVSDEVERTFVMEGIQSLKLCSIRYKMT
jgi:hypothetical protein